MGARRAGNVSVVDAELFAVEGVDSLYELEPSAFVAARDELVKRLKADGDKTSAAAVKKLARPSIVAWAVNQVARRDPGGIDKLVHASAAVREAQAGAVRGEDAAALRKTSRDRRDVVQRLADAAAELAGAPNRDEAAAVFEAAGVDDALAAVLRAGRLSKAPERVSGFGLEGLPDPPTRKREVHRVAEPQPERESVTDAHELDAARAALAQADDAVEASAAAVERAEDRVRGAAERLEAAQAALATAQAEREDAEAARASAAAALQELGSAS